MAIIPCQQTLQNYPFSLIHDNIKLNSSPSMYLSNKTAVTRRLGIPHRSRQHQLDSAINLILYVLLNFLYFLCCYLSYFDLLLLLTFVNAFPLSKNRMVI